MSKPQKFRKKPVEIEAMQVQGDLSLSAIAGWMMGHGFRDFEIDGERRPFGLTIHTLEGDMNAAWGDWIIRGVQGEFYPCKPSIFTATYEGVSA